MTQRKKSAYRSASPGMRPRAAAPAPRERYRSAPARRSDPNRRMITFSILIGGALIAVFVILAGYQRNPGGSTSQPAADTRALEAQIGVLQERLRQNPLDLDATIKLGDGYYDLKRWAEAVPWYEKALQTVPANTNVRTDLGTAYLYSGNPDKAKEQWLKVLEQEPNKLQTHYNLGVLYAFNQTPPDYESAAREWETVIRLGPNSEDAKTAEKQLKSIGKR